MFSLTNVNICQHWTDLSKAKLLLELSERYISQFIVPPISTLCNRENHRFSLCAIDIARRSFVYKLQFVNRICMSGANGQFCEPPFLRIYWWYWVRRGHLCLYLYWTKWRSGQVLPMPYGLTDNFERWGYSAPYKV